MPGGFKARGLRVKGDDTPIAPGEFRDVDVPSGTIKDNLMPLPYKEPSQVLYSLLGTIVEEGRRFASAGDMKVSDMSANAPVGTTLAILERTLKTMSAIQARIHYSMRQEFKLLKAIIRDYTPEDYPYEPEEGDRSAKQSDYDQVDVIPVSDPNAATMAQKIVQYQAVLQLAQGAPQIYDLPQLHRQMLDVLGIKNAQKLIPLNDDMKPTDPVSENMAAITNKPIKAFIYQDHQAHITTHVSFMQDPKIAAMVGQSPNGQALMASLQAHIAEHLGFAYRRQVEEQLGITLPMPDEDKGLPEEVEVELSRLVAEGAQRVLGINQAEVQAQQAQQAAQDPVVQMQQQDMMIKGAEVERKKAKDQADIMLRAKQLELEEFKAMNAAEAKSTELGAKIAKDKEDTEFKQELEGTRMGVDIARSKEKSMIELTKLMKETKKKGD